MDTKANLLSAFSSGDIDRVISLIGAGASPFTTDDKGNTLFHLCCTNSTSNGSEMLQYLVTDNPIIVPCTNHDGDTPLHLACMNGLTECVKLLMSGEDNVFEFFNNTGLSPLYYASKVGHIDIVTLAVSVSDCLSINNVTKCITGAASWEIVQLLLMITTLKNLMDACSKHKCIQSLLRLFPKNNDHTIQLSDGRTTLLHLVAVSGDLEYFTAIINQGFDINGFDSAQYTPVHRAIIYGCVPIAKYLINQSCCLCETLTINGMAPLHDAAGELGNISLVQCLVEKGVNVNISSCSRATPLHYSCFGHLPIVEYLTSLPQCNYTLIDDWGRTGIHFAAEFGQTHVIKYLVEARGFDINVEDKYGKTPLLVACLYDHLPVVEYLMEQTNCNIICNNGTHPLIVAVEREHLNIVKHFIDSRGCNINVRENRTKSTLLHKACYNGSLSIVEYLISKPQCNIEALDSKGKQPLYYAVCQGHREIIFSLSERISLNGLSNCINETEQYAAPEMLQLLKYEYETVEENHKSFVQACIAGNFDIVHHFLINKHCDVNFRGQDGYTPLHWACDKGHSEVVRFLTSHADCNMEAEADDTDKPLHVACASGNVDIVHHLVIEKHCNVNAKGRNGYTPLHWACHKGKFEVVKLLTGFWFNRCNFEAGDDNLNKPLHLACASGNADIIRHLLSYCTVNAKGQNGYTALHLACHNGNFEVVKLLTACSSCNIEAEDDEHDRPLHLACAFGSLDIVHHLVDSKFCNINSKGQQGYTPLHWACDIGNIEVVYFLSNLVDCNIEAETDYSDKPLHLASASGNVDIVRYLLIDKHCDVNVRGWNGWTPLHWACDRCHSEVVRFLTSHAECNMEAEADDTDKPLHLACASGNVDIVQHFVIDKHCDINVRGWNGYTPLHYACSKGHSEVVRFLTSHADCNMEAEAVDTDKPLHLACASGNVDIVRYLVTAKHCDINVRGWNGYTPLHWACDKGHLEVVCFLTSHTECNMEAEADDTDKPLHVASASGNVDIVHHLVIDKHCDINVRGWNGCTPLHYACSKGHLKVAHFLTSHAECNMEAEADDTDKPLHVASASGNVDIVRYLVTAKHCDINVRGWNGYTPLHWACHTASSSVVYFLTSCKECNTKAEDNDHNQPIHVACAKGDKDIVHHFVIHNYCNVNVKGQNSYTPLHWACYKDSYEVVRCLTSFLKCNKEAENDEHDRLLHLACAFGNVDIVHHLVTNKCDISAKGKNGYTALHWACHKGKLKVVKLLTGFNKFNFEAGDDNCDKPLHLACASGNADIIRHLLCYCNVNAKGRNGYTALHLACHNGNFEVVKLLTDCSSCNIEAKDNEHDRPLHLACAFGSLDIVRHLANSKFCNINAKGQKGYTPLHWACDMGNFEVVYFLSNLVDCNIEAETDYSDKPLHLASASGNVDIVRHLVINKHCDVSVKGKNGYTPLHCACQESNFEVVQFLTNETESNVEAEADNLDKPLHIASESGNVDIVYHLVINKHCDINARGQCGYTPLHCACHGGNLEVAQFLTSFDESLIEAKTDGQNQPLHLACQSGNLDIVQYLVINKHCSVHEKGSNGYTPLHWACKMGCYEIVNFLMNYSRLCIEAETNNQDKPLHLACASRNLDTVRLLFDKHCDINAKGFNGNTPLHAACETNNFEIVKFLTNQPQCNMEAEDIFQRRALQLALESNHTKIVNYLVEVKDCRTEGIGSNMKTQGYLQIHQSSGIALLRVVKCILTGPPGAGKSTLKKRLLDQSLDTEPSLSTGVIDAAVQIDSYRKLSQHNAVVSTEWKEQELDEEAVLVTKKLLPSTNTSYEAINVTESDLMDEMAESLTEINAPLITDQHNNSSATSSPMCNSAASSPMCIHGESAHHNLKGSSVMKCDNTPTIGLKEDKIVPVCDIHSSSSLARDRVKGLSNYMMNIPLRKRQGYEEKFEKEKDEDHTVLHIIDTGGQPEFHEILPALITGPAINLLVFKLTEELRSRYKIIYRTSTGNSKPYETSLTHEEVIFRSLASIACLRQNTIGWNFDKVPVEDNSEPVAFLIATHRDQVDDRKVSEVNQQLRAKIENSSQLFDSNLVQFSQSKQVIFPLDTTKDEEKIKHLRSQLHKVMSENFYELRIPASWCALSLKLRKSKRKIFKYKTCFQLALDCGIKDKEDFQNALWYLHHRVGLIMHYPNVKILEDIIITDLQLVFDRITNLITTCFTFEKSGSAAIEREFCKSGRFPESQIDKISLQEKGDSLNAKRLVALLKHLYIVAGPMKTKVCGKIVNYYFMPCALKPADVEQEEKDESLNPAPLLICFECGFTPVGVFCCLVVYLLGKNNQILDWKLTRIDQYRNRITFKVGQYCDTARLISHATYLEVQVQQRKGSKLSISDLCDNILSSLHKGLETVTESLHYTYKSKHMFGVLCNCATVPHPAVIEFNEETTDCINGSIVDLDEKHLHWSKKIVELNDKIQKSSSTVPPETESCHCETPHDIVTDQGNTEGKVFLHHLADITDAISTDVMRIAVELCAQSLIPTSIKNDISSLHGVSDFEKANRVTSYIQKHINSSDKSSEYLSDVCDVLSQREDVRLKEVATMICQELDTSIPQDKNRKRIRMCTSTDDDTFSREEGKLLDTPVIKRPRLLETIESSSSSQIEAHSFGRLIESRGHKRLRREDELSESDDDTPTTKKLNNNN